MIGIVIVTHGKLADELAHTLEHITGPQTQLASVCIMPNDDGNARRQDILDAIHTVNTGEGVVVLTDLFGGTPTNLAISLMNEANIDVIAGVNVPLLLKLADARPNHSLADSVSMAQNAGQQRIIAASHVLSGRNVL